MDLDKKYRSLKSLNLDLRLLIGLSVYASPRLSILNQAYSHGQLKNLFKYQTSRLADACAFFFLWLKC